MDQNESPANHKTVSKQDQTDRNAVIPRRTGIAIAVWVFLLAGGVMAYVSAFYVNEGSVSVNFFVGSLFSIAAVIVVIIQAVIYDRQAKALDAQLEENRRLVAQNERAVKAAEDNVATVEKTAIYANRAYVVAKIRGAGKQWPQLRLRIQNTGNTPANNVIVAYDCGLREEPPHTEWPDGGVTYDAGYTEVERLGLIAPESSYHVIETPLVVALDNAQTDQWQAGKLKFYCWGRIYYEDIFNDKRHTDFCFVMSVAYPKGYPCEHGNQAI